MSSFGKDWSDIFHFIVEKSRKSFRFVIETSIHNFLLIDPDIFLANALKLTRHFSGTLFLYYHLYQFKRVGRCRGLLFGLGLLDRLWLFFASLIHRLYFLEGSLCQYLVFHEVSLKLYLNIVRSLIKKLVRDFSSCRLDCETGSTIFMESFRPFRFSLTIIIRSFSLIRVLLLH